MLLSYLLFQLTELPVMKFKSFSLEIMIGNFNITVDEVSKVV